MLPLVQRLSEDFLSFRLGSYRRGCRKYKELTSRAAMHEIIGFHSGRLDLSVDGEMAKSQPLYVCIESERKLGRATC